MIVFCDSGQARLSHSSHGSYPSYLIAFFCLAALPLMAAEWAPPDFKQKPLLEGQTDRPLHFYPDGFAVTNGPEFFNRPLYGPNTAFRVDGGDKPEFMFYLPGRGGNLRLGIRTAAGAKWLHNADSVETAYHAGVLRYVIRDSLLKSNALFMDALPLNPEEGLGVRIQTWNGSEPVELVWAYGGASGRRGSRNGDIGCEREPVSRYFQLNPEQCRSNVFEIGAHGFELRSKTAVMWGNTQPPSRLAIADASQWNNLDALLEATNPSPALPIVIGRLALEPGKESVLVLSRKRGEDRPGIPGLMFQAAMQLHKKQASSQLTVETPDPFVNSAIRALPVAAEGVWDESQGAFMHGAVAWRVKLLGWRGAYSADELGRHDRARRYFRYWASQQNADPVPDVIPPADPEVNLARNEPALHSNGDMSKNHYDMNLVYIDALFRHLLWTGDLDFAREMWPVIERHLAWERRLFRRPFGSEKLPLYEAYCCIWASDDLQYNGGGAAHSTAYNYYHNKMAARVARLIGRDPSPYEKEAALIWRAMHENLWLADRGWFGEYKDYLGLQRVHPSAGLWTFYHTVDSEAATPLEAWQASRFIDTQIAHIPVRGPGVPNEGLYTLPETDWMPYYWSINNVVMAETAHTALAYWQAGRTDAAFRAFKGCIIDSMYMGLCPGNLGMCTGYDVNRGEAQRDFADAVGTVSRALVEGLYGIHPDALAGEVVVRPGFPQSWTNASLRHPDVGFEFNRNGRTNRYEIAPKHTLTNTAVHLQIVAERDLVASVTVNGKPASWRVLEDSVDLPRIEIQSPAAPRHEIAVVWSARPPAKAIAPTIIARGGKVAVSVAPARLLSVFDPQGALTNRVQSRKSFSAIACGAFGHRTVFAQVKQGDLIWWLPVMFEIRPAFEIVPVETQTAGSVKFRIRNNTLDDVDVTANLRIGSRTGTVHLNVARLAQSDEITQDVAGLLPGAIPISMRWNQQTVDGSVVNWHLAAKPPQYDAVNMTAVFNDRVTQIFQNEYVSPRSPFCSLAMPKQGIGGWCEPNAECEINDAGLRAKAGTNGQFLLPNGIPFNTPTRSNNIAFVSQWDNYPREIRVPLSGAASHAYLLMAGSANPMQCRFDVGEIIVQYTDGTTEQLALHSPDNWWPIEQDYWIDDYAFRRPGPIPPRVDLATGEVRILDMATFKGQGRKIPGGAATVLDLPLNPSRSLQSLTVRALANEVVIGLMSATLAR